MTEQKKRFLPRTFQHSLDTPHPSFLILSFGGTTSDLHLFAHLKWHIGTVLKEMLNRVLKGKRVVILEVTP